MNLFTKNYRHNSYEIVAYHPSFEEVVDDVNSQLLNNFKSLEFCLLKANKWFFESKNYDKLLWGISNWNKEFHSICGFYPFNAVKYQLRLKKDHSVTIDLPIHSIESYHPDEGYLLARIADDKILRANNKYRIVSLKTGKIYNPLIEGEVSAIENNKLHLYHCNEWGESEAFYTINEENDELEYSGCFRYLGYYGAAAIPNSYDYTFFDYGIPILERREPFFRHKRFEEACIIYPQVLNLQYSIR